MLELPQVTIVVCTYDRPDEIRRTVTALKQYLNYPADKLNWIIADDSSPKPYLRALRKDPLFEGMAFAVTPERGGWGWNVNHALSKVATDLVFFVEDDYELTEVLNLDAGAAIMQKLPHVGMLRFRGTAGGELVLNHQYEVDIADFVPGYAEGVGLPGKATYMLLDSASPELYLYSHGPHLKRASFHQFYGMYPEGLKLGQTEETYAHHVKDAMKTAGAPCIAIQPHWIAMRWNHIGQSRQGTELDTALAPKAIEDPLGG